MNRQAKRMMQRQKSAPADRAEQVRQRRPVAPERKRRLGVREFLKAAPVGGAAFLQAAPQRLKVRGASGGNHRWQSTQSVRVRTASSQVSPRKTSAPAVGFTPADSLEAATSGVRVNAVAPGPIETGMLNHFTGTAEAKAAWASRVSI